MSLQVTYDNKTMTDDEIRALGYDEIIRRSDSIAEEINGYINDVALSEAVEIFGKIFGDICPVPSVELCRYTDTRFIIRVPNSYIDIYINTELDYDNKKREVNVTAPGYISDISLTSPSVENLTALKMFYALVTEPGLAALIDGFINTHNDYLADAREQRSRYLEIAHSIRAVEEKEKREREEAARYEMCVNEIREKKPVFVRVIIYDDQERGRCLYRGKRCDIVLDRRGTFMLDYKPRHDENGTYTGKIRWIAAEYLKSLDGKYIIPRK